MKSTVEIPQDQFEGLHYMRGCVIATLKMVAQDWDESMKSPKGRREALERISFCHDFVENPPASYEEGKRRV